MDVNETSGQIDKSVTIDEVQQRANEVANNLMQKVAAFNVANPTAVGQDVLLARQSSTRERLVAALAKLAADRFTIERAQQGTEQDSGSGSAGSSGSAEVAGAMGAASDLGTAGTTRTTGHATGGEAYGTTGTTYDSSEAADGEAWNVGDENSWQRRRH